MWDAGQLVYGFVKDLGKFLRHEVTRSMVSIGNQVNHQKFFAVRLIMSDLTIRICPERCKSSSFRGAGSF